MGRGRRLYRGEDEDVGVEFEANDDEGEVVDEDEVVVEGVDAIDGDDVVEEDEGAG